MIYKIIFILISSLVIITTLRFRFRTKKIFLKKYNKLQIIITTFNPKPEFLIMCLNSLKNQTYKNYSVCILDDCSDDEHKETYKSIIEDYCKHNHWQYIFKNKNNGPLLSRIECIQKLNPDDEDIIVSIDGDDYLYSINSLEILNKYYQDNTLLTFGNYISKKEKTKKIKPAYNCFRIAPVLQKMYENNLFRQKWLFSHLKTFKYKLYKKINHNDLKDKDNKYFTSATDLALMYPMIEMSNGRFKCVNEILYVYNHFHSESNHNNKKKKQIQKYKKKKIKKKKPYSSIF